MSDFKKLVSQTDDASEKIEYLFKTQKKTESRCFAGSNETYQNFEISYLQGVQCELDIDVATNDLVTIIVVLDDALICEREGAMLSLVLHSAVKKTHVLKVELNVSGTSGGCRIKLTGAGVKIL